MGSFFGALALVLVVAGVAALLAFLGAWALRGPAAPWKRRVAVVGIVVGRMYVDEFGDVHWCSQTRGIFKKPLGDYTGADLRQQFCTRKRCSRQCTVGCVRSASRFDEWRAQQLEMPEADASS